MWLKCKRFILFWLLLSWSFVGATRLLAQGEWVHMRDFPVLEPDKRSAWDSSAVFWPAVIRDGDTLRMWYCGSDDVLGEGTVKIGYAWSRAGITWRRGKKNPVLEASLPWENGQIISPAVLKDGDQYHMWYGAGAIPSTVIGYATSSDGIHWIKHGEPVLRPGLAGDWDSDLIGPGTVIKQGSLFLMWYWGGQGQWPHSRIQVGLAFSTNGITWIKYDDPDTRRPPFAYSDPVLAGGEPGSWDFLRVWTPAVLPTEEGYQMWYAGREDGSLSAQMVGFATSRDGVHWRKFEGNPVIEMRPSWGYSYLSSAVLHFNEGYHLWYTSFVPALGGETAAIGYAWSPAPPNQAQTPLQRPEQFVLFPNFPNPFNGTTIIQFTLPVASRVRLTIHDLSGRLVRTLLDSPQSVGIYAVTWDGRDDNGQPVASGIYFYRFQANRFVQTRQMVLIK